MGRTKIIAGLTLLFGLVGCSSKSSSIRVGSKNFTEQVVLGEIIAQHLEHPWWFAVRVGVVTGLVTAVGIIVNPYIEYHADRLPQRVLGVLGIALILCGFALQSGQYWVALLDVRVV